MFPVLFQFNLFGHPVVFYGYGTMLLIALAAGIGIATLLAGRGGFGRLDVAAAFLAACLAALAGARLLGVAADYRQFLPGFPFSVFDARLKGMAAYGGFLGGFLALWGLARYRRWPLARLVDMAAVGAAIGTGFARIGCFLAGCCFGCPAALPWAVVFPAGSPAYDAHRRLGLIPADALGSLAVHPVQLYESAFGFGLFGLLLWVYRRRKADGSAALAFFGLYAMFRFWVETLRCDAVRGVFAGLSTSQYVALATAAAVVLVRLLQRRTTRSDPAP